MLVFRLGAILAFGSLLVLFSFVCDCSVFLHPLFFPRASGASQNQSVIFLGLCACLVGAACSGSYFLPTSDVLLRFLQFRVLLLILRRFPIRGSLFLYDVVLVSLCPPSASFGCFVPALVFRAFFLLRSLFSGGRTAPALFLLFWLFRVLDQLGFVLRSVLTVFFCSFPGVIGVIF